MTLWLEKGENLTIYQNKSVILNSAFCGVRDLAI